MNTDFVAPDQGWLYGFAQLVVSEWTTAFFCIVIAVIAVWVFCCFRSIDRQIRNEVNDALNLWEKPSRENIDCLSDRFAEQTRGCIAQGFADYLRQVKSIDHGDSFEVYSFNDPERYFNEDSVYLSRVNLELYRAMPGILTGLGIFFTFIGLACGIVLAVPGLTTAADMQNLPLIVGSLTALLDGASQAFWTSVAGLAFSMLFVWLLNIHHNQTILLIGELVEKLRTDIPVKRPEDVLEAQLAVHIEEKNTLARLEESWEGQMNKMFDTLMESFAAQSKEQTDRMVESLASIKDGIALMSETQADLLGKTLTNAADVVGEKLGQKIDGMAASFKDSADSVGHAVEGLDGMLREVTGNVREVSGELKEQIETLKTAVTDVEKTLIDQMNEVTDRVSGLVGEINKTTSGFYSVAEEANAAAGQLKTAGTESADELTKGAREAADGLRDGAEAAGKILETEIGKSVKEMNTLIGEADRLVTASTSALEIWQAKLGELSEAQTRGQQMLDAYDKVAEKMLEATRKVEATSDTLTTNMSEQARRTEHMNETINERLAEVLKLSEAVAEQQRKVSADIKIEQELVETHLKSLSENLTAMNNQMRSNLSAADVGISSALSALTTALDGWVGRYQDMDRVSKALLTDIRNDIKHLESERQALHEAVQTVVTKTETN